MVASPVNVAVTTGGVKVMVMVSGGPPESVAAMVVTSVTGTGWVTVTTFVVLLLTSPTGMVAFTAGGLSVSVSGVSLTVVVTVNGGGRVITKLFLLPMVLGTVALITGGVTVSVTTLGRFPLSVMDVVTTMGGGAATLTILPGNKVAVNGGGVAVNVNVTTLFPRNSTVVRVSGGGWVVVTKPGNTVTVFSPLRVVQLHPFASSFKRSMFPFLPLSRMAMSSHLSKLTCLV
jgi:hypothetical protein